MTPSGSSSSESDAIVVPSPISEFSQYQDLLKKTIISAAQNATALPAKNDLSFERTLDRQLAKDLDTCSDRILSVTGRLLSLIGGTATSSSRTGKGKSGALKQEDLTDGYHSTVVDALDSLYENIVRYNVARRRSSC